jgi:TonB family protein
MKRKSVIACLSKRTVRQAALLFGLALALIPLAGCSGRKMDCASLDPSLTYCPPPPAPRGKDLTGGKVVVQVAVLPNGTVADARVLSSSGHPIWADAVLRTVKRWRFKPTGHEVTKVIPFRFMLGDKAAAPAPGPTASASR